MASFTWDLHPVPTVYPKIYREESSLQTPTIPRISRIKSSIYGNKIPIFQAKHSFRISIFR